MRVNEKLGIPEGINQEANKLHRKLFKDIDELSLYVVPKVNVENPEYNITIGMYNINQYMDEIETSGGVEKYKQNLIDKNHDGIILKNNTTNYYEDGTYDIYIELI